MGNFVGLTGFPLQFRKNDHITAAYGWPRERSRQGDTKNIVASLDADGVDASWLEPREPPRIVPAIDTSFEPFQT